MIKIFVKPLLWMNLVFFTCLFLMNCDVRNKDKQSIGTIAKASPGDTTTVTLIDTTYNFGQVKEGDIVEYNFRFKNSGNKPLVISNVSASCGCTVPEKPEEPIMPGEEGFIKVKFNSDRRPGDVVKSVNVVSNAHPEFSELFLKGKVLPKNPN